MKNTLIIFFFLLSFSLFGQSIEVTEIGVDTAGFTIIKVVRKDTLDSGDIIRTTKKGLLVNIKAQNKAEIKNINREIARKRQAINWLKDIKVELRREFNLDDDGN